MKTHYVPVERPDVHPAHEVKEQAYATTSKIREVDCDDCLDYLEAHGELGNTRVRNEGTGKWGESPIKKLYDPTSIELTFGGKKIRTLDEITIKFDPQEWAKRHPEEWVKQVREAIKKVMTDEFARFGIFIP